MKTSRWPLGLISGAVLLLMAGCATTRHSPSSSAGSKVSQATHSAAQWLTPSPQAQGGNASPAQASATPPRNLWQRMRRGFTLEQQAQRPRVARWVKFYLSRRATLEDTLQRAEPFMWHIVQSLHKRHMPMELALLPAVESAFNPRAYSSSDAVGLWQFLPGTGRRFGLTDNWWYDGRRDVRNSTRAALDYLQYLSNMFHGDWLLAIAAYNAGGGRIQDAVAFNKAHGRPTDFWNLPLPHETACYVPKLLAIATIIAHPARYGIQLPPLPNKPLLRSVKLPGQMDLRLVARLSGISLHRVYALNPGYKRWATPPGHDEHVLLPIHAAARFDERIAQVPRSRMVTWLRHRVARGDTLGAIARHFGTTVASIKRINHLHGNLIRVGQNLLIPHGPMTSGQFAVAEAASASASAGDPPSQRRKAVYRVKRGDSLWQVAQHYHVRVADLARWNGISRHADLRPGETLKVHLPTPGGAGRQAVASRAPAHYTVKPGDSLWAVANRYHMSVADLARRNGISEHATLKPGQTLQVDPAGASDASHSARQSPAVAASGAPAHYTVKPGDSLWAVANRYHVSVADLARRNGISEHATLKPGQTLHLSAGGGSQGVANSRPQRKAVASSAAPVHYTVKPGDSLWAVAHRYGVSVSQLALWNGLSSGSPLKPGQVLRVPHTGHGTSAKAHTVYYTVKQGDSLWHIAQLFQVNVHQLESWNDLRGHPYLKAGQQLKVVLNEST